MDTNKDKIIMFDSDEAAQKKTITGWVSSDGYFYSNDEKAARYRGCTHKLCQCGMAMKKFYTTCESCRSKKKLEIYKAMPFKEWNVPDPLYSETADKYFYDSDELLDYCEEEGISIESLRLVICEPVYPREINLSELYSDLLPDNTEGELPKYLQDLEDKLNQTIQERKEPLSWIPGKYRTEVKGGENGQQ